MGNSKHEILYGVNPVIEMLIAGRRSCKEIMIADGNEGSAEKILAEAKKRSVRTSVVVRKKLDDITGGKKHQGVVALVGEYQYAELSEIVLSVADPRSCGFVLLLDGVVDPQNFGSLVRTAHLLGAGGIVIPKDNSCPVTETVSKASAGAVEHAKVAMVTNLVRAIDELKDRGFWVFGSEANSSKSLYDVDFKGQSVAIVMGGESRGIRRLVRDRCDVMMFIPMMGRVTSFNASAAGALVMGEVYRQRSLKPKGK